MVSSASSPNTQMIRKGSGTTVGDLRCSAITINDGRNGDGDGDGAGDGAGGGDGDGDGDGDGGGDGDGDGDGDRGEDGDADGDGDAIVSVIVVPATKDIPCTYPKSGL